MRNEVGRRKRIHGHAIPVAKARRGPYRDGMSAGENFLHAYLRVAPLARALIRSRELELIASSGLKGRVLDLGHGDGHFAALLAEAGTTVFVAVDRSLPELQRARGRTTAHLVVADMERLPLRSGVFSAALSNCVLEHVENIHGAFCETARVLAPEGRFLTTVVTDRYELLLFWPRFFGRIGLRSFAVRYLNYLQDRFAHRRYISAAAWSDAAREAGLVEIGRRSYAGPRRQMLMDITLPGILWGRMLRALFGREVISPIRWPARWLRSLFAREDAVSDSRLFANVMLELRKK